MTYRHQRGSFPSLKMKRTVRFSSSLVFDYIYTLEFDTRVTYYQEAPFKITLDDGSEYVPSFLLHRNNREVVVECSQLKNRTSPENIYRLEQIARWCGSRDADFELVDADDLRSGFRLRNIKALHTFAHYKVSSDVKTKTCNYLHLMEAARLEDIMHKICPEHPIQAKTSLYCLAWNHYVELELNNALINPNTLVTLPCQP